MAACQLFGQIDRGTIEGVVKDQSGAVVPNARVQIIQTDTGQAVPLPEEFRFATPTFSIRREGDAVILEPVKPLHWPEHFFDQIRIDDPAFARPAQGTAPAVPLLD